MCTQRCICPNKPRKTTSTRFQLLWSVLGNTTIVNVVLGDQTLYSEEPVQVSVRGGRRASIVFQRGERRPLASAHAPHAAGPSLGSNGPSVDRPKSGREEASSVLLLVYTTVAEDRAVSD